MIREAVRKLCGYDKKSDMTNEEAELHYANMKFQYTGTANNCDGANFHIMYIRPWKL